MFPALDIRLPANLLIAPMSMQTRMPTQLGTPISTIARKSKTQTLLLNQSSTRKIPSPSNKRTTKPAALCPRLPNVTRARFLPNNVLLVPMSPQVMASSRLLHPKSASVPNSNHLHVSVDPERLGLTLATNRC